MSDPRPTYESPDDASRAVLPVICTARAKSTGRRCSNRAILGGHVCRMHGGAAPQVRAAANARILQARDLALESLITTLTSEANFTDPAFRLKAVSELTKLSELIEGRATARTDDSTAKAKDDEVVHRLQAEMDRLQSTVEKREAVLRVVHGGMGSETTQTPPESAAGS